MCFGHPGGKIAVARRLADLLGARAVSVCLDERVLRPGDDWHRLLPRFQRESMVTVALVADGTADADYENSEIVRAIEQVRRLGHRFIPVHLAPDLDPPYGTEQLHRLVWVAEADGLRVADEIAEVVAHPDRLPPLRVVQILSPLIPAVSKWFTGRAELVDGLAVDP